MKVEIPFEQLLAVVKTLTPTQIVQLKHELDVQTSASNDKVAFLEMLLKGPVYTDAQIQIIEENRKSIAEWRTNR